jgi:uncharacterized protein (TIGR03086 family)
MSDTPTNSASELHLGTALRAAADLAQPVIDGIPDGMLKGPTPCTEYDVQTLVNHLFHVLVQFRKLATKGVSGEFGTPPDYVAQGPDWRQRFAAAADELIAAWSAPGADEGTHEAWNMPMRTVGAMALLDIGVHGWDLARATGQTYEPGETVSEALRAAAALTASMLPRGREMGMFAQPVTLPEGYVPSEFERVLVNGGRDPRWTPEGATVS